MDYVLLSPEEAAILVNLSAAEIVALIESGELGGLKVAGQWRIPLKAITQMLAVGMEAQTARALERVFEDHATWQRVFGAHPEVTQSIETGEFPVGSVGAYLKEAIALAKRQHAGQVVPRDEDASVQDAQCDDGGQHRA